jgi:hypothetical protein
MKLGPSSFREVWRIPDSIPRIGPQKSAFYEQVTGVKGFVFVFSFISVFAFVIAPHVALHRVSMRTLMS